LSDLWEVRHPSSLTFFLLSFRLDFRLHGHGIEVLAANESVFSPIKSMNEINKGKTILKLGIFEKVPAPEMECFVKDRQGWLKTLEGTTQYKIKLGGEKVE
jgi:hypothetical protein